MPAAVEGTPSEGLPPRTTSTRGTPKMKPMTAPPARHAIDQKVGVSALHGERRTASSPAMFAASMIHATKASGRMLPTRTVLGHDHLQEGKANGKRTAPRSRTSA